MPEVLVIESMGNGVTKEVQEMDFDPVPREGDFLTISLGSATAKFVVEAVIHKVALGKKNKLVLRVRNVGGSGAPPRQQQPQQYPQQLQQYQPQALPPGPVEASPGLVYLDEDDYGPYGR